MLLAIPTIKPPTVVVEAAVGNTRGRLCTKDVEVGSKVKVPAVFTLNALVELTWRPSATIRMSPPGELATGEYEEVLFADVRPRGRVPEFSRTRPLEVCSCTPAIQRPEVADPDELVPVIAIPALFPEARIVIGFGLSMFGPSDIPVLEAEEPVILIESPETAKLLVA